MLSEIGATTDFTKHAGNMLVLEIMQLPSHHQYTYYTGHIRGLREGSRIHRRETVVWMRNYLEANSVVTMILPRKNIRKFSSIKFKKARVADDLVDFVQQ